MQKKSSDEVKRQLEIATKKIGEMELTNQKLLEEKEKKLIEYSADKLNDEIKKEISDKQKKIADLEESLKDITNKNETEKKRSALKDNEIQDFLKRLKEEDEKLKESEKKVLKMKLEADKDKDILKSELNERINASEKLEFQISCLQKDLKAEKEKFDSKIEEVKKDLLVNQDKTKGLDKTEVEKVKNALTEEIKQ